jgi:hypothetical protein
MRFIGKDPNITDAYYTAVADGSIAAGKPVIATTDGKVKIVATATISGSQPIGSTTLVDGNNTEMIKIVPDPFNSNRWAAIYMDDVGNKDVFMKVFTRSGTTITQSSAISLVTGGSVNRHPNIVFDRGQENVCLIMYNDNSNDGVVRTATISGSAGSETVSLGTAVDFHTPAPIYQGFRGSRDMICLDTSGNFIAIWGDASSTLEAVVFQVSGTSVTVGSIATVATDAESSAREYDMQPHASDSSKVFVAYRENGNSYISFKLLTISGTSISVSSASNSSENIEDKGLSMAVISDTKIIVGYAGPSGTGYLRYRVVTYDGSTSFSYGTEVVVLSSTVDTTLLRNNEITNSRFFPFYYVRNPGSGRRSYARSVETNADASSITVGSEDQLDSSKTAAVTYYSIGAQTDDENHYLWLGEFSSDLYFILGKSGGVGTDLTSENYIGITDQAYTDGQEATVAVVGCIDRNQTGLTAGQQYFVQGDATLDTTAGNPSVLAGTAISATELVVKE